LKTRWEGFGVGIAFSAFWIIAQTMWDLYKCNIEESTHFKRYTGSSSCNLKFETKFQKGRTTE
jgi:hypothetical protein